MKKLVLIILIILVACVPVSESEETEMELSDVLDEFDKLDNELGTSWKKEEIPTNMIELKSIEPWTASMLFLKDRVSNENDAVLVNLVEARIQMLKSQLAYYLMAEVGEKGFLEMARKGQEVIITEKINCDNVDEIAKVSKLHDLAFMAWLDFSSNMDNVLHKSQEAKEKLGTNENRMAFYSPAFADTRLQNEAIQKALKEQCDYELELDK